MRRLSEGIIQFFQKQGCVIVATVDANGFVHTACKGIVKIETQGQVYLLDLYRDRTYANLKRSRRISITAVDEHRFTGYCLKGRARIINRLDITLELMRAWEDRITSRLTQRVLKNMREEKGHPRHPEILLPEPEYMILMEVTEIVDLTPQHLK